jgi:aspartyl-tRNA(Asn)/glutamyl-tRNA(Gln) amidotransferase subunit A
MDVAAPTHPADLNLLQAAAELRARRLSAVELLEACQQRIEERNGGEPTFDGAPNAVNAWIRLYPEIAAEQARAADARLTAEGEHAPTVCGIPLGLKDLYGVEGLPLTGSSRVLDGNVAERDAIAWQRLRDRGMVLMGHTHTHEFAAGGTTDQVGNPWDLTKVAGGSSGGSGAALAVGMVPAALGSDTCGSLRIPSALCGTSTIKPTHGRIPMAGVLPLAPTLDHVGPMARTIADCAALLSALAEDGPEPSGLSGPPAPLAELPTTPRPGPEPLQGLTIALNDRPHDTDVEPAAAAALEQARNACEQLGARVVEAPAPRVLTWDDLNWTLLPEVWAYHSRHAERRDSYRPAILELVDASKNFTDAQVYIATQARRAQAAAAWEEWLTQNGADFILELTLPISAPERGPGYDPGHAGGTGDPLIALTVEWDMTGLPVASLPVPGSGTIPFSVSLIARRGGEAPLTQAAIDLQEHALGLPDWPG